MRTAIVVAFEDGADAWGQQLTVEASRREIEMTLGLYRHQATEGPKYQDVEFYGLTRDKDVGDGNVVEIAASRYKVLFTNPYGRMTEVFMREWHD